MIDERLFITQGVDGLPETERFRIFKPMDTIFYSPFCDDFGPMNLASIVCFVEQLDYEIDEYPDSQFFYCVEEGKRNLTNAVFLVGTYMILRLDETVDDVCEKFEWIDAEMLEGFRDATHTIPDFELSLRDCWAGLVKSRNHGWFTFCPEPGGLWGSYDIDEYIHYDCPLNGDMHVVVPDKFMAFAGPVDLGGAAYCDDESGWRRFSPSHYAEIFKDYEVEHVVRLNEPQYDSREFQERGIEHHSLEFEDCTAPPTEVVEAFLNLVESSKGMVAVHCRAGLGRTGTLIALYLMQFCGFTAREAMGWLRIVRPGSVIGEQQHYLCAWETGVATVPAPRRCAALAGLSAAQVAVGMAQRGSVRAQLAMLAEEALDEEEVNEISYDPMTGEKQLERHGD